MSWMSNWLSWSCVCGLDFGSPRVLRLANELPERSLIAAVGRMDSDCECEILMH